MANYAGEDSRFHGFLIRFLLQKTPTNRVNTPKTSCTFYWSRYRVQECNEAFYFANLNIVQFCEMKSGFHPMCVPSRPPLRNKHPVLFGQIHHTVDRMFRDDFFQSIQRNII